jgi:hypothetical protein
VVAFLRHLSHYEYAYRKKKFLEKEFTESFYSLLLVGNSWEKLRVNFKIALFTFDGSTSHKLGCLLVVFLDTCIQWVKPSWEYLG